MINITFPNGDVKAYESGVSAYEIAQSISPRLAAEVLAAKVNDTVYDLALNIYLKKILIFNHNYSQKLYK